MVRYTYMTIYGHMFDCTTILVTYQNAYHLMGSRATQTYWYGRFSSIKIGFLNYRTKNWSIHDWRTVLFSNESPFGLFHSPNWQNDIVWLTDGLKLGYRNWGKLQVWDMMSYNGLEDLHIIPKGQNVNAYYIEEIICSYHCSEIEKLAVFVEEISARHRAGFTNGQLGSCPGPPLPGGPPPPKDLHNNCI